MNKRKSFILHLDSLEIIDELTDEQVGKLLRAMRSFNTTGEIPELDKELHLVFIPFKNQFIRDNEKYNAISEARRKAALKRAAGNG